MSRKHDLNLTPRVFKNDFMEGLVRDLAGDQNEVDDQKKIDPKKTPVDIIVKGNNYLIRLDIPGVTLEDVDITIENGVLVIAGNRQAPFAEFNDEYQLQERSFGHFKRSFKLSDQIDFDGITADLTSGVLEINLPKKVKEIVSMNKTTLLC